MINFKYIILFFCIASMAAGQILFKIISINYNNSLNIYSWNVFGIFFIAVFLYFLSTIAWVYLLTEFNISKLYPFFAFSFVFVPIAGIFLFDEKINIGQMSGYILIIIGIIISGLSI
jgi:drug/metabolite transporter (DMT)-like permease